MTVQEAARALQVGPQRVYKLIWAGRLAVAVARAGGRTRYRVDARSVERYRRLRARWKRLLRRA